MKNLKRILAITLASVMIFSVAGCKKEDKKTSTKAPNATEANKTDNKPSNNKRKITIGTWFEQYYTSAHTDINDNPSVSNIEHAEMQLANMRAVEEKYNIELYFENLTWDGVIESINTSILAGTPDCDIYQVDLQFGIPAALNNLAMPLSEFIKDEDSDIFADQIVMKYLDMSAMGMDDAYLFAGNATNTGSYLLAYNKTILDAAGLEDPQELYDKGEWTWAKWKEQLKTLTIDKDSDGATDQYGFGGFWTNALNQLMMSNATGIATGPTEALSSDATIEVLQLFYDIYNVDKTARPWNEEDWDINNFCFMDQEIVFFIGANWIFSNNYDTPEDMPFDVGLVPWPCGPSGNALSNPGYAVAGNYMMIPVGTKDPATVYNAYYDWVNWYAFDITLRDDTEWAETWAVDNDKTNGKNFEFTVQEGKKENFDIWGNINAGISMIEIMNGTYTPAQFAETYKNAVQDALDNYFVK